jgi:glycosyltransferase involved in cell wall biosynthesis
LLKSADVVFTGGYQLFRSKSQHHANTHFYGCGVDAAHFGSARSAQTPVAPEIAALPRPLFGYFGVIDERLDYELISHLADAFPDGSVAMVGPFAKIDPAGLPRQSNIHWLGQRSYAELPGLVKGFDVCLMPFALNEATQYINPTKTLEYMAAGKPIVSTAVPDVVRNFTPVVRVAGTAEEFAAAVDGALRNPDRKLIAQGIECAADASWDAIVGHMREHILDAVRSRTTRSGAKAQAPVAALLLPSPARIAAAVVPAQRRPA